MDEFQMPAIGIVHSPFKEKFGLPRQPGLIDFVCEIEMFPPYNSIEAFVGLEDFSHIWVSFVFHQAKQDSFTPMVRPPRLGGNQKKGVFATRSPFRPSSLGLSVVRLENILRSGNSVVLQVNGLDVVDLTPVVDIKPYIPYADCIEQAKGGFAGQSPQATLTVEFSDALQTMLKTLDDDYLTLIKQVIALDPRPAYKQNTDGEYGMLLGDYNLRWSVFGDNAVIFSLTEKVASPV